MLILNLFSVVPAAPTSVTTVPTGTTSLNVAWQAPNESDTYGVILYYIITCDSDKMGQVNNLTKYYNISDLKPYTNYECCISAVNLAGEGNQKCDRAMTFEGGMWQKSEYAYALAI